MFVQFKCTDGKLFELDDDIAFQCRAIKNKFEGSTEEVVIMPVPDAKSSIIAKVIDWMYNHVDEVCGGHDLSSFEASHYNMKFFDVAPDIVIELVRISGYLELQTLYHASCQAAARFLIGRSPEDIRYMFNIKDDMTKEEKEEVQKELEI